MSWLLPRLVGLRKAQEIILTNRRVKADEAEVIGLVTRLVDDDQLRTEGKATAATLARSAVEAVGAARALLQERSEEHTSELQSLMRISYAVFCLKKKKK